MTAVVGDDLAAYLTSKGQQVFRAAGQEVTAHCLWCADGDPKGKGKLYLNTESWLYSCKRCGAEGNRRTLLVHFGDEDTLRHAAGADPMVRRRILKEAAEMAHEMLIANARMLAYLTVDRGLHPDLIQRMQLGYVPKNFGISESLPSRSTFTHHDLVGSGLVTIKGYEFFNDSLTIPYFSHGSVIQIREKKPGGKYRTTANDVARLYNADSLRGADEVLIVEGEYDTDAILTAVLRSSERSLESLAVVGLPGANAWPDGLIDMLSAARKVYIGLDPDPVGKKAAAKLKGELGTKGRLVLLPEGEPKVDWTDWFLPSTPTNSNGGHDWRDLRDLLAESDLAGKHMFSIGDAAAKWRKAKQETPGLKLGWGSIDSIIRPGLKPGQVMIPLARTGTGKTVWLSNVAHNLRGQHVLYVSLEMTASEVFEHLHRIHRFWFPIASREQILLDHSRLQIVERNRIGRGDIGALVSEYQDLYGRRPDLVIIDYLQYYARGFRGQGMYDRVSEAVMELKAVAKEELLAVISPSQVNRSSEDGKPLQLDAARDAGTIEETGDFVLSLYRPDRLVNKDDPTAQPIQSGSFNAQLLKSRHGGAGKLFQLRFSLMSLAIVDPLFDKAAASRVEQENSLYRQGVHYDDYRRRVEDSMAQRTLKGVS